MKARWTGCGAVLLVLVAAGAPAGDGEAGLEARIEALERKLSELDRRLQALEAPGAAAAPAATVPAVAASPGQWKDPERWSYLRSRMTEEEVVAILGSPVDTRTVGKFDYWYYGEHKVVFYLGRVDSWVAP